MTREEAIDILQGAIKKPNTKDGYLGQAIDMAIEALEQERSRLAQITQYRNDCEKLMQENEQLKKALEQETYNDAISRQAVIEQTYNWSKDEFLRVTNPFDYLRKRINSLPSVRPQEPFDIETYCKEHFCVMVDKDVWEKSEKALKQEPKTGHWIKTISENGITSSVRCSECGFEDNRYMLFRYCPNCGAKMESEVKT